MNSHLWKNGPTWLSDPSSWPPDIVLEPTVETMAEAKVNREIFSVAIPKDDSLRAGSLVWTGSLYQELARRMG